MGSSKQAAVLPIQAVSMVMGPLAVQGLARMRRVASQRSKSGNITSRMMQTMLVVGRRLAGAPRRGPAGPHGPEEEFGIVEKVPGVTGGRVTRCAQQGAAEKLSIPGDNVMKEMTIVLETLIKL